MTVQRPQSLVCTNWSRTDDDNMEERKKERKQEEKEKKRKSPQPLLVTIVVFANDAGDYLCLHRLPKDYGR